MRSSVASFTADTAAAGAAAAAATTATVLLLGHQRDASAWAPLNAVSHIMFGDEAARQTELSARYTGTGAALNSAAVLAWAAIYISAMRSTPRSTWPAAVALAAVVSAGAYVTDYHVVPRRLTPGFEKRLDGRSLFAIYSTLAAGLAAGWLMRRRHQR